MRLNNVLDGEFGENRTDKLRPKTLLFWAAERRDLLVYYNLALSVFLTAALIV